MGYNNIEPHWEIQARTWLLFWKPIIRLVARNTKREEVDEVLQLLEKPHVRYYKREREHG
jgi:hypothetical protein